MLQAVLELTVWPCILEFVVALLPQPSECGDSQCESQPSLSSSHWNVKLNVELSKVKGI